MITLNKKTVHMHSPFLPAVSEYQDTQYTFCQDCEQNIERWYNDTDTDCIPSWSRWVVSK